MTEIIIENDEENEDEEEEGVVLERRIKLKADHPGVASTHAHQSSTTTIKSVVTSSGGLTLIPSITYSFAPSPTIPDPVRGLFPSPIPSATSLHPFTHLGSSSSPFSFLTRPIT